MRFFGFGRSVRYIAQMEMAECGAACLAMVLGFHGRHVSLAEAREACGISRDGTSAYAIARAAERFGLSVEALSLDLEHLSTIPLPAVLHWEFNHFVVLESVGLRSVVIVDPDVGRYRVSFKHLARAFTGIALTFVPNASFERKRGARPSLRRYRGLLARALPSLGLVFGASLALDVVGLLFPAANQILIDLVVLPRQTRWLWAIAAALLVATLARTVLVFLRSWVIQNLQFALDLSLMGEFLEHLLKLPIGFFQTRTQGDLVRRVQGNMALRDLFTSRSVAALLDTLLLFAYAGLMLAYHVRLGAVVISIALVRVGILLSMRSRIEQAATTELAAAGREGGALVEALAVPEVTKAFGTEGRMLARYSDKLVYRVNSELGRRRLTNGVGYLMLFFDGASKAAIVWFGGREVLADRMTIGVLSAFMMLQLLFAGPLESIVNTFNDLQFLGRQLQRLDDVMETPREPSGERDPGPLHGAIELEDVEFRYGPSARNVIDGVNIKVQPGEKVALVGRSGAGKSTLARLLLGMHWPTKGSVRVDGVDLRELDVAKVRAQFGVVLQEPFLFDDTVRANIALNDEELPLERVREAARVACIEEAVDGMPDGFETRVGQRGIRLSGGQRQRIAVARAIAHRPAVLLLDEATSSLDRDTERSLHANLADIACTRIVIAHRLATVQDADRIFVLDGGRIVDQGKYTELSERPGLFRDLVRALV